SPVVLHRRPQAVRVQTSDVVLAALAGPARHDRLPLVVHLQHELAGLGTRVAEQFLENERDVVHEVDRVVPHQHDPGEIGARVGVAEQLLDGVGDDDLLGTGLGEESHSSGRSFGRSSAAMRESKPLTNRPESLVEYCFASSTASVIATAVGTSGHQPSSNVPMRNNARSTTGMRSSDQCSENLAMISSISSRCASTPRTSVCAYSSGGTGSPSRSTEPATLRCSHS